MEKDISIDLNQPAEDPHHLEKKPTSKETMKFKRAEQELRKCMGMGKLKLEESVLKTYSCAWQKDILVHGRLHLTQNLICFYSNILGWETKTSVHLKDVTAISKQRTALVFPNAILIEAGDKKYGFSSFVHRDRVYKVLQLIWHNSQLHKPSTVEFLKTQLLESRKHRQSHAGRRSKSPGEDSDIETNRVLSSSPPTHFHSLSLPSTPHTSNNTLHPKLQPSQLVSSGTESDFGASEEILNQVDGQALSGDRPTLALPPRSYSSCSSDAGSDESSAAEITPSQSNGGPQNATASTCTDTENSLVNNSSLDSSGTSLSRSPSLLTLKSSLSDLEVEVLRDQPEALLGGSPNWKRTLSITDLWQTLIHFCTPTRFINMLIILFIILLLLSTVSMLCQLSQVEPAFHPFLSWQPWCACLRLS